MTGCRSNQRPYPIYSIVLTGENLPKHLKYRSRIPFHVLELLANKRPVETPPGTLKQKIIQTIYRESEAQTDPYTADYPSDTNKNLEILTLNWLSWNNGLPAGYNEVLAIERARQKRAWEAALPPPFNKFTADIRATLTSTIEINRINFLNEIIDKYNAIRMDLTIKMAKERCREDRAKLEERLHSYIIRKKEEKNKDIQNIRKNFSREMRKLNLRKQKIDRKFHRWNIIRQFTDKTSELYAPQMRFGGDPSHWSEKISPRCGYWKVFRKLEILQHNLNSLPKSPTVHFNYVKKSKPRVYNKDLCIRATKWTEQNLEKLHEELRSIRRRRYHTSKPCALKQKVIMQTIEAETQYVTGPPDEEEALFQACLFLQKTIKGRAIQAVMFEGRVKCQELIEELKSTHALQNNMEDLKAEMRQRVYNLQRQADVDRMQERRKNEILSALEGKTTGDMLDFLAKELQRLQDERKTHAQALEADQQRHKREAVEAGRRQVEEQRRREHDEMLKQVMKIHQNAATAFLIDIMTENRNWLAHREAREYVTKVAKKVDQEASESILSHMFARSDHLLEEEIIADLIHNFALPEAEKRLVRERLNKRQMNYLKICHDEVYTNIEKIVEAKRTRSGELLPMPMVGKHRIPPMVRVKYLRLKRMHESSSSSGDSQNSQASNKSISSVLNEHFLQPTKYETKDQPSATERERFSSGFSKQDVVIKNEPN